MKLRGLYAITPELAGNALRAKVAQALAGGIAMLQYRNKKGADLDEARSLAAMCRERGVPLWRAASKQIWKP